MGPYASNVGLTSKLLFAEPLLRKTQVSQGWYGCTDIRPFPSIQLHSIPAYRPLTATRMAGDRHAAATSQQCSRRHQRGTPPETGGVAPAEKTTEPARRREVSPRNPKGHLRKSAQPRYCGTAARCSTHKPSPGAAETARVAFGSSPPDTRPIAVALQRGHAGAVLRHMPVAAATCGGHLADP